MTYLNDLQNSKILPFDIVQVIPGTVIGPSEFVTTRSEAIKHIDRQTKALLFDDMIPRYAFGFVHVQDCARVHVEALDERRVQGKKLPKWFVAAATTEEGVDGQKMWVKAADMVEREFGDEVNEGVFKVGRSKVPTNMPYRVESGFTEGALMNGEAFRSFEECVQEVAQWYLRLKMDGE